MAIKTLSGLLASQERSILDKSETKRRLKILVSRRAMIVLCMWGCEHQKGELKWPQTFKTFHVLPFGQYWG